MIKNTKNNQKGAVAILLVLLILFVLLLIGTGISRITSSNLRISGQTEQSLKAYQTADSGLEYALWKTQQDEDGTDIPFSSVPAGAKVFCSVTLVPPVPPGEDCDFSLDNCNKIDGNQYCIILTDGGGFPLTNDDIKAIRVVSKVNDVRRSVGVTK